MYGLLYIQGDLLEILTIANPLCHLNSTGSYIVLTSIDNTLCRSKLSDCIVRYENIYVIEDQYFLQLQKQLSNYVMLQFWGDCFFYSIEDCEGPEAEQCL